MSEETPQGQPAPSTGPQPESTPPAPAEAPPSAVSQRDGMNVPAGALPPAPGGAAKRLPPGRSRQYRDRRLASIKESGAQDGFLIFLGVALTVLLGGYVAYQILAGPKTPPPPRPIPLTGLFNTRDATEISPGRVRLVYNFDFDPKLSDWHEACPQTADWELFNGWVERSGVLISGERTRFRPFFAVDDLSVECGAALLRGTQISLCLRSIETGRENEGYRFDLYAARGPGGQPFAQITEWRRRMDVARQKSPQVPIVDFRPRGDAPFFYRLRFELSKGILHGWYQGQEVCSLPASPDLPAGVIEMWGEKSRVAFDNVVIVGRPHPEVVAQRKAVYEMLQGPEPPKAKTPPAPPPQPQPRAPGRK